MYSKTMYDETIEKAIRALGKELDKEKEPINAERVTALVNAITALLHSSNRVTS